MKTMRTLTVVCGFLAVLVASPRAETDAPSLATDAEAVVGSDTSACELPDLTGTAVWLGHTAATQTSVAAQGPYRGNVNSKVFHKPGCRYYNCTNCTAVFQTREAAINAGYRPGGHCKP